MRRAIIASVAVIGLLGLAPAAQDGATPTKYTNVNWYSITNVDYYPNKAKDALKIVYDHFVPAAQTAGMDGLRLFEYATGGEWDLTVIFPMKEGPAEMEWENSPEDVAWMKAIAEKLGGMAEFEELMGEYLSMVKRYDRHIARERTDWMETKTPRR